MIEIKFHKVGTILYSILNNKIISMEVIDFNINSKDLTIMYLLKQNCEFSNTFRMDSENVFDSLESLKNEINKQFDELTPKEIEKCTTDTEDKKE